MPPARVPAPVLDQLAVAAQGVRSGAVHARLLEMGFMPMGSTPEEFTTCIESESAKWTAVVKAGGIRPGE